MPVLASIQLPLLAICLFLTPIASWHLPCPSPVSLIASHLHSIPSTSSFFIRLVTVHHQSAVNYRKILFTLLAWRPLVLLQLNCLLSPRHSRPTHHQTMLTCYLTLGSTHTSKPLKLFASVCSTSTSVPPTQIKKKSQITLKSATHGPHILITTSQDIRWDGSRTKW